jgi:hypothetical protein
MKNQPEPKLTKNLTLMWNKAHRSSNKEQKFLNLTAFFKMNLT